MQNFILHDGHVSFRQEALCQYSVGCSQGFRHLILNIGYPSSLAMTADRICCEWLHSDYMVKGEQMNVNRSSFIDNIKLQETRLCRNVCLILRTARVSEVPAILVRNHNTGKIRTTTSTLNATMKFNSINFFRSSYKKYTEYIFTSMTTSLVHPVHKCFCMRIEMSNKNVTSR